MSAIPSAGGAPAGWYPDPQGQGQRYWDGFGWTQQVASAVAGPKGNDDASGFNWVIGITASLLIAPAGLILGIYYALSKRGTKKTLGIVCACLSATVIALRILAYTSTGA